ncbi:DNA repair protein RecO [Planctomycetales bacterium]|nr:DNA repair protein RecO [Planctomycetales bacterium]
MQTTEGLIIRTVDFSETSRIITAYTRQYGKIEALAKGGRQLKGPFESSLDILARNSLTYIHKRGEVLDLLTESKLIRRFRVVMSNLAGTFGAHYIAELLNAFTELDDAQPPVYDLAVKVLRSLEKGTFVMRTLLRFEGRFLQLLGLFPSLRNCVECNRSIERTPQHRLVFGHLAGGVLCQKCFNTQLHTVSITSKTLNALEQLTDSLDRNENWKHFALDRNTSGELRGLMNQYISHRLGWRPRSHDWLRLIADLDNTR